MHPSRPFIEITLRYKSEPWDRLVASIVEDFGRACELEDELFAQFWRGILKIQREEKKRKMHPNKMQFWGDRFCYENGQNAKNNTMVGYSSV